MRLLAALSILVVPALSWGYTTVETAGGTPSHWGSDLVQVQIDLSMPSRDVDHAAVQAALDAAVTSWSSLPEARVALMLGPDATVAASDGSLPKINAVRFFQKGWAFPHNQLANTQLYSHPDTGEIIAAVIEVNEQDHHFTMKGGQGGSMDKDAFDLEAVLTHEVGHLLGLGHSLDKTAAMFASTKPLDTQQRMIGQDDRMGVAAIYDQALTAQPNSSVMAGGCSVATTHTTPTGLGWLVALGLLLIRRPRRPVHSERS